MRRRHLPKAFTLLELLVAVAIMAVLIGLLLGAVQKVRDRAAAATVADAARQVVLATHNYAATRGGRLPNVDANQPNQGRGLFEALYPDLGSVTSSPVSYDIPIPLLRPRCDPTWQATYTMTVPPDRVEVRPDEAVSFAVNPLVFRVGARLPTAADDGLSQTSAVVTHYAHCKNTAMWPSLQASGCVNSVGAYIPCDTLKSRRTTFADQMYFDVQPVTSTVNGVSVTVGSEPHTYQHRPLPVECDHRLPQSLTAGGLTVGMADGSVRTVRPDVSQAVFWGAVTPNGGEVLAWDD